MPNEEQMYRKNADNSYSQFIELTGSNVTDAQTLWTPGMLYNGATSDKPRGNTQGTLLASAARTASAGSANQTSYNAKGVLLFLNITVAGTGGLKVTMTAQDPTSGASVQLNVTPTAILATGMYCYELYPGSSTAGTATPSTVNQRTSGILPRTWGGLVTHVDASSWTYSLSYSLTL